ncbi:MAG: hypothetical protein ACREOU_14910 [Candidatus Eiseniibacteriota bacterium]
MAGFGGFGALPALAGPPAGSSILNTAGGLGTFPGGVVVSQSSNTVRTIVSPLERLELVSDTGAIAGPGTLVRFPHRLTNLGNAAFAFWLDLTNTTGDAFDLIGLSLTHDVNANGILDGADIPIPPGGTLSLGAGVSAELLVSATVPLTAPPAQAALLALTATGVAQGGSATNVDTVTTPGAPPVPDLAFYTAADFAQRTSISPLGQPLFLEARAPACDTRPAVADTIVLALTSELGADEESYLAFETGPSTGVFRIDPAVPTAPGGVGTGVKGDRILVAPGGDRVIGSLYGCGATRTDAAVWIEPEGFVFDSRTNAPLAGARIELIDVTGAGNGGNAGGPATVYESDGVTPAANAQVTGADGRFAYLLVPPSTYRITVVPPAGHRFPSAVTPDALPSGRTVDPSGSYGGTFLLFGGLTPVNFDVPLDADPSNALFVEKRASRRWVEPGDALDYVVLVANRSDVPLDSVVVTDALPAGFALLAGTARVDDLPIADPAVVAGPERAFGIGTIGPGVVRELSYRVRVGAGTVDEELVNRAYARSGSVVSNVASAGVELRGGVFADQAMILGTVFVDANRNRRYDLSDPGLPGVRLYLDDGTFAVTDPDGRYSFYDLPPRTHALKLDPGTLPSSARLVALSPREEGTPGLRFVDLERGDLYRADFGIAGDSTLLRDAKERLIALAAGAPSELGRAVRLGTQSFEPLMDRRDPRTVPASAITTGESLPIGPPASPAAGPGATRSAAQTASTNHEPLESRLAGLDGTPGFLDFASEDTVGSDQVAVRVKGPIGAAFVLRVNGVEVSEARVGRKITAPEAGVELWEYVGVGLAPGPNRIEFAAGGPPISILLVAPDRPDRIDLSAPAYVPADGYTPASIEIRLTDARGVPVTGRTLVTLEASLGRLVGDDLDPTTASLEIAIEGGHGTVGLLAQGAPGVADVRAHAMGLSANARVEFLPDARPLIAVGTLEGAIGIAGASGGGKSAALHSPPLFEAPFVRFESQSRDGGSRAGARGTLFLKGRVKHDILLTLGYDSDRPNDERRLRDIRPDAFYPLYGDASVRGYEAQSSRSLYARVDRRGASLLYGDFVTPGAGGARTLAAYSRSLNGVAGRFEDRRLRVNGYTSRDRARRQVDEIRGRGVSGPYTLTITPLVENSERVEVIVRDRNQSSLVLKSTSRQRFTDYEVNPFTGDLLLRAPVPSVDEAGNPVYLRVSYEVETGGEPYWVTGFEARGRVRDDFEIGGTWLDDHAPDATSEIRSVFFAGRPGPGSIVEGEFAATNAVDRGRGAGGRLEWRHTGRGLEARTYGSLTGSGFWNPTSGYGAGRAEAGGRVSAVLSARTRVLAEAIYTGETDGKESRGGLLVALDRKLSDRLRGELGSRLSGGQETGGAVAPFAATVRGKLTAQIEAPRDLSAYLELEQDTQDWERRLAAIGAESRLTARTRVYGRHEFISSFVGPYSLDGAQRQHTTLLGFDANVTPESRVFSEYRVNGALQARDAEAAIGLRNVFRLPGGARLNASFERIQPLGEIESTSGGTALVGPGATTALTAAVDYAVNPLWKGSARAEFRTSRTSEGFLTTLAGAMRIDRVWSALGRNYLSVVNESSGRKNLRNWLQVGFSYRSGIDWDALARYELRLETDRGGPLPGSGTGGTGVPAPGDSAIGIVPFYDLDHVAHVVSIHGSGPLNERTSGSLAWAGKIAHDRSIGVSSVTSAHWLHGRAMWAIARRYDAGLSASYLASSGSRRGGIGAELGRRLDPGVWLSLGFNFTGYADDELTGEEYTRQGLYLRIRARFDESLFVGRSTNRPQAVPGSAADADDARTGEAAESGTRESGGRP